MANGQIISDPEELIGNGAKGAGLADEFMGKVNLLYTTINEMITSNFMSPDARVLAGEIETKYHGLLNDMANTLANYSGFLGTVGKTTIDTQTNSAQNVKDRIG